MKGANEHILTEFPNSRNFSDIPTARRLCIRRTIEDLGGHVAGYSGECVTVAMPRDRAALITYLDKIGLTVKDLCYFPLGSDKPPEHLRHFVVTYQVPGDPPAYWLYYKWAIKEGVENV